MDGEGTENRVDFGIVVALSGELHAILRQFDSCEQHAYQQSDTRTYYTASLPVAPSGSYQIVVSMLHSMGNVEAALATNDLIRLWSPRNMLVVGIAGGLDRDEQNFGDIVVGESMWYYEPAKIADAQVKPGPRVIPSDVKLIDRARNYRDISWLLRIPDIAARRIPGRLPQLHFGPMASGEKVIASGDFVRELRKFHRKLAAVEMEGAGAASAALSAAKHTGFLAIRGISDFADAQKNDDWHDYAASTAAAWTFGFLSTGPIAPQSRSSSLLSAPLVPRETTRAVDEVALFNEIRKRINMDEFKTLCFVLGVDVDDVPGETKTAKVRELILRFKRRDGLSDLASIWQNFKSDASA